MPTFRNTETGRTFRMGERWASHIRNQPNIVELTEEGIEIPTDVPPVAATDPALRTMRKADLEALAAERGLSTEGTKADLAARLERAGGAQ